jgi:hypothetical protein
MQYKELFFVTVEYGNDEGVQVKSGYVCVVGSHESETMDTTATQFAMNSVRQYSNTIKVWSAACTPSSDWDSFKEQESDYWDKE